MPSPEERFRAIFDATYAPIVAYVRRRAAAGDVDDVVAEVFTVAWRRLDDVPLGDRTLPWLYGTARRVLANHRRGGVRRLRLVDRLQREPAPPRQPSAHDETALVALGSLSAKDQEVLRLAAWEGLGTGEIAVALGCTANAAALRLSRARARLRAAMTDPAASRTGAGTEGRDG